MELLALLFMGLPATASGAVQAPTEPIDPFSSIGFETDPYLEMSTLMEVTIFHIDVLTLSVRVPMDTAERLREVASGREYSEALADSVAAIMLGADRAWARQVLHRGVGFGRLTGGILETTEKAADAGYITREYLEEFESRLPELFGFLQEESGSEGDEIFLAVGPGFARTIYRRVSGEIPLDRTTDEEEARRASIAAFFAPDTRFRRGLVESLIDALDRRQGRP